MKVQKEPAEIQTMVEEHVDGIYEYALRTTRDSDIASDIAQEVLARYMELSLCGRIPSGVSAGYLYRMAQNEINGYFRKNKRLEAFTEAESKARPHEEDVFASDVWQVFRHTLGSIRNKRVSELLDMHYRKDMSIAQIAPALKITRSLGYKYLDKGNRALKEAFERSGIKPDLALLVLEYGTYELLG